MKRFHMKKDQSGPALCTAVERSCPNGEFGHYDSQYEVLMAYEHAINEGKVPGLATLASLKRGEISASREELERDLTEATDETSYVEAIAFNIHPLDANRQREILTAHSDDSPRSVSVRERIANITNSKAILDSLSEEETNPDVIDTVAENPHLEESSATILLSRFKGERLETLKRYVAYGNRRLLEERVPVAENARETEVQATAPNNEVQEPRPVAEIARELIQAYADFNKTFTALDTSFSSMRSFVNKSNSFPGAVKEEIEAVLSSPRQYGRALHGGGIAGKPALEKASISFEKRPSLVAQKVIRKLVENQLRRKGLNYGVAFEGDKLVITPVTSEEMEILYRANRAS